MITSPEQITQSDSQPGTTIQSPESRTNVYLKGGIVPEGNNVTARWEHGDNGLTIEVSSVRIDSYPSPDVVEVVRCYFDEDKSQEETKIDPKDLRYAIGFAGLQLLRTVGEPEKEMHFMQGIKALLESSQQ